MRFLFFPFVVLIFCAGLALYMHLNDVPIGGFPGPIGGFFFLLALSLIYAIFHYFDEKKHNNKDK